MSVFSVISTIISCTGLIGLVAFKLGEKTKELGIRKVIGASPTDLVCLQLKSTLLNVFPAALFGCVVANIVFGYWQAQFSSDYRLEPSFSSFVIATGAVIGLTLLTTSFQTLAAVSANPVRSLRYE
jgi:ABC-type antimicrobial peptide transport system permease subunit